MIVIDTNVIAYLMINGERTAYAEQALRDDANWVAPLIWRSEFRNVLALYVRRSHISENLAIRTMEMAEDLMRGGEYEVSSAEVLGLAVRSGCSAYDCEFVSLAMDLGVSLLTNDRRVLREFRDIAIPLGPD